MDLESGNLSPPKTDKDTRKSDISIKSNDPEKEATIQVKFNEKIEESK